MIAMNPETMFDVSRRSQQKNKQFFKVRRRQDKEVHTIEIVWIMCVVCVVWII